MGKDFHDWHYRKTEIHNRKDRPFFHEREIWSTAVGLNVGFEVDGKGDKFLRPIVVVKKFNAESLWAVSLSRKQKTGKYYFPFIFETNVISTANLSQLKLIDSKRLQYKIGDISSDDFDKLKQKLRQLIA